MRPDLYRTILADVLPRTGSATRVPGVAWLWRRLRFTHAMLASRDAQVPELIHTVGHLDSDANLGDHHYDVLALPPKWSHLAGRIAQSTGF